MRDNLVGGISRVDHRLEDLYPFARDHRTAEAAHQLLALARKHRAADYLYPANIAGYEIHMFRPRRGRFRLRKGHAKPPAPSDSDGSPRTFFANHHRILSWHRFAFQRNRRDRIFRWTRWQTRYPRAELILLHGTDLAAHQQFRRGHLRLQAADSYIFARPIVDVHVQRVAFAREQRVIGVSHGAGLGGINRLAVTVHPFPHLRKDINGFLGDRAIGFWPDVEQIITAVASAGGQVLNHLLGCFPAVIRALVAPTVIHRHAGFPRGCGGLDVLLRRGKIFRQTGSVVDDDLGLQLANHAIHLRGFPTFGRQGPVDVIPEHVQLAVIRAQFADLPIDVVDESPAGRFVRRAASTVGVMPIH